ncbi:hypothetical protein ACLOJK_010113 [Asimina triloba]
MSDKEFIPCVVLGLDKPGNEQAKQYVHLLNSTLTATERTICCILENYQKEDGIEIPKALQPFMGNKTFLPFQKSPVPEVKGKKSKAKVLIPPTSKCMSPASWRMCSGLNVGQTAYRRGQVMGTPPFLAYQLVAFDSRAIHIILNVKSTFMFLVPLLYVVASNLINRSILSTSKEYNGANVWLAL